MFYVDKCTQYSDKLYNAKNCLKALGDYHYCWGGESKKKIEGPSPGKINLKKPSAGKKDSQKAFPRKK